MRDLFENPVKSRKVRKNVYAYLYPNGIINIAGIKYQGYSITEAIKKFRQNY